MNTILGFLLFISLSLNILLFLNGRKWKRNYLHSKVAQTNKLIIHQELRAKRNAMREVPVIQKRGTK